MTSIGYAAFSRCSGLTCVTIPNSVTDICGYAFYNCALSTVLSLNENPSDIPDNAFYGSYGATLYVPIGTKEKYEACKGWKIFNNIVEKDMTVLGDANGDMRVNVSDIVEIVNDILGKPSAKYNRNAADVNGDGQVNVTDIVNVVNDLRGLAKGIYIINGKKVIHN